MTNGFPIDFVRQAIEQRLYQEHLANTNFIGGKNKVALFSLYEQLLSGEDVDRYVETFRELTEQQNRSSLILNGVLSAPENPTITNIYSSMIIPMDYTCVFKCKTSNRDQALETINNMIEKMKGRKVDIAELKCKTENGYSYVPFVVGTIGQGDGAPTLKNGDYLGEVTTSSQVDNIIDNVLIPMGVSYTYNTGDWFYVTKDNKITVAYWDGDAFIFLTNDGNYPGIIFPPEHESFKKYKLSLSFDAMRCDTPFNLNGNEIMMISFGGSATLVSEKVKLGNDLLKISISKTKILNAVNSFTSNITYLEPLEMPSGNSANTKLNQLVSNKFLTNTHTDATNITLQYTFIVDTGIPLLDQLFHYARYGTRGITINDISQNMIFTNKEYWCSWGEYKVKTYLAKIVENIDIENTESDTLTLTTTFQVQGENN